MKLNIIPQIAFLLIMQHCGTAGKSGGYDVSHNTNIQLTLSQISVSNPGEPGKGEFYIAYGYRSTDNRIGSFVYPDKTLLELGPNARMNINKKLLSGSMISDGQLVVSVALMESDCSTQDRNIIAQKLIPWSEVVVNGGQPSRQWRGQISSPLEGAKASLNSLSNNVPKKCLNSDDVVGTMILHYELRNSRYYWKPICFESCTITDLQSNTFSLLFHKGSSVWISFSIGDR